MMLMLAVGLGSAGLGESNEARSGCYQSRSRRRSQILEAPQTGQLIWPLNAYWTVANCDCLFSLLWSWWSSSDVETRFGYRIIMYSWSLTRRHTHKHTQREWERKSSVLCLFYPVSMKALCFLLSIRHVRFVHSVRYCYHNISRTSWTVFI